MTITTTGIVVARYNEIRDEMVNNVQREKGTAYDLSNGSLAGQLISLLSLRLSQSGERVERFRECIDPDASINSALNNHAVLGGLLGRNPGESNAALRDRRSQNLTAGIFRNQVSFNELYRNLIALGDPDNPTLPFDIFDVQLDESHGVAGEAEILILASGAVAQWGQPVADVIFNNLVGGMQIETDEVGTEVLTATDSTGRVHTYTVGLPTAIDIELDMVITSNSLYGGDAAVRRAALPPVPEGIVLTVDTVHGAKMGAPVVLAQILCRIIDTVQGILTITLDGNIAPGAPLPFDIPIPINEFASFDVADMTIT